MHSAYYKVKSWCDAKDKSGIWRIARIKKKTKNLLNVHFDGWSDKHKQTYCIHSSCLAPMRMYSKGYTGQQNVTLRDWDYNEDNLSLQESQMSKLASSSFKSLQPYDLSQYIRGDLFVLIDCLLTYTYTNPTKDIPRVQSFLSTVLDFCFKYLESIRHLPISSGSYLTSQPDALIKCSFEVLETIRSILGCNKRTSKFFERYKFFTNSRQYCKSFSASGLNQFLDICKKFDLDDTWHLLKAMPKVVMLAGDLKDEGVRKYVDFVSKIFLENPKAVKFSDELVRFGKEFEEIVVEVYGKEKKAEVMAGMQWVEMESTPTRLEVIIESPDGSFIEHEDVSIPLEEVFSPQAPKWLSSNYSPWSDKKKLTNHIPEVPLMRMNEQKFVSAAEYSGVLRLVEEKHEQCVALINNAVFYKEENEKHQSSLEEYLKDDADCLEMKILDRLEYLISRKKIMEALEIVRWRKKICRIAMLDGWEIADTISKSSVQSLKITSSDLIQANLNNFLLRFD